MDVLHTVIINTWTRITEWITIQKVKITIIQFFHAKISSSIVLQSAHYKYFCMSSTRNRFVHVEYIDTCMMHCTVGAMWFISYAISRKLNGTRDIIEIWAIYSTCTHEMGALIRVQSTLDSIKIKTSGFITTVQSLWRIQHMRASCFIHLIFLHDDMHTHTAHGKTCIL